MRNYINQLEFRQKTFVPTEFWSLFSEMNDAPWNIVVPTLKLIAESSNYFKDVLDQILRKVKQFVKYIYEIISIWTTLADKSEEW